MTPETSLKRQLRQYLRYRGWFCFPLLQGLGCHPGLSDMVAIKAGRVLWIEVKAPGGTNGQRNIPGMEKKCSRGRQSEKQAQFQLELENHGGEYVLVWGIEDLERVGV